MNAFLWSVYIVLLVTTFVKSYLHSSLKPNQEALIFFLQAIKSLLPAKEKLGLVLAKMDNMYAQYVCVSTFMQLRQDSVL